MARISPDVVLACLDDIRSGRRSLERCLAEHPEAAGELRPLAGVVSEIRVDAAAMPETARLRGRAQLLAAISSNGHRPAEEASVLAQMRRAFWLPRWAAAVGAGLSALAAGGAVVYASQGASPDSPLYPVRAAVQAVSQAIVPAPPPLSPSSAPSIQVIHTDDGRPQATGNRQQGPVAEPRRGEAQPSRDRQESDRSLPSADHDDKREAEQRSFAGRPASEDERGGGPDRASEQGRGGRGVDITPRPSQSAAPSRDGDGRRARELSP